MALIKILLILSNLLKATTVLSVRNILKNILYTFIVKHRMVYLVYCTSMYSVYRAYSVY